MSSNPSQLSPEIMVFFGLRTQPFSPPANLTEIYPTQYMQSLREKLETFLLTEDKLTFLTGESGVGSSVMVKFLIGRQSSKLVFFPVEGNPSLNSTEVLLSICRDYDDQEQLIRSTKQGKSISKFASTHLFGLMAKDMQPVIIIDQAHAVSPRLLNDIIRFCEAINSRKKGVLKLVLVFSGLLEKFAEKITGEWMKQKDFQEFKVHGLGKGEAKEYLLHRLKGAGLSVKLPITEQTIMVLAQRSRGLPAALDKLVIQTLNSRAQVLTSSADEDYVSPSEQDELENQAYEKREKLRKLIPALAILAIIAFTALGVFLSL